MSKLLKITEQARLSELESTIERTKTSFVECGKALAEIRDSRLYRKTHDDFESYCKEKFGWVRSYANRLIKASTVAKSLEIKTGLETLVSKHLDKPLNAAQAIALANVPEEKRADVIEAAAKTGSVSGKALAAAAKNGTKDAELIVRDDTGYIVPPRALPFWERRKEAEELAYVISKARSAISKLPNDDPMFAEVKLQGVVADLGNAYRDFKQAIPYAVCPSCQGQTPKSCALCRRRGVISKFLWDTAVPKELKDIRAKSCKK